MVRPSLVLPALLVLVSCGRAIPSNEGSSERIGWMRHFVANSSAGAEGADHQLPASESIPLDEIGVVAGRQYSGDGLDVVASAGGARLGAVFQKLEAEATEQGLWIVSTEDAEGRLRLVADAVGRGDAVTRLVDRGSVAVDGKVVSFIRPAVTEQYTTSLDGVRQDFVLSGSPDGDGPIRVELALTGARAKPSSAGATLTLDESGRALAYTRLRVVDGAGQELSASLEVLNANRLAVIVDDATAQYPVRIDPTFSDADWVSLNPEVPGTEQQLFAVAVDAAGAVYVGGNMSVAGSAAANNIAKWDGSAWSALGTGMNGSVTALPPGTPGPGVA